MSAANTFQNFVPPYINGRFISLDKPEHVFQLHNPANPNDILARSGWHKELVDSILDGMKQAQKKFQLTSIEERLTYVARLRGYLADNHEEIKSQMMLELSRSRAAVEEEWQLCENLFKIFTEFCQRELSVRKEDAGWEWSYAPLGLVLMATNIALPFYSLLSSALPALMGGNAVCVKPSSHCLLSGSLLANGFHQAAFPPGLIQFVYGNMDVFRRLLLTHQFDTVLCTGGEESLEQIRRDASAQQNIRLVLCGGGKNAVYVTEQADLAKAIPNILYGSCVDAGQRLEATGLVFVAKNKLDEFQDQFIAAIKKMPIGAREDLNRRDTHVMEPLCSLNAWDRYLRFQGIAAREACETLRWGKPIDNHSEGYFVSPGVHLMQATKMEKSVYASNAFFGPDVCLIGVEHTEEVISLINSLKSIRALSVHSAEPSLISELHKQCHVPTLLWNAPTTTLHPLAPSSGRGNAGSGYTTGVRFLHATVGPQSIYTNSFQEKNNR